MTIAADFFKVILRGLFIGFREYLTQRPELYSPKYNPLNILDR